MQKNSSRTCPFATVSLTVVDTTREAQPYEFLKDIHGGDGMGDLFSDDAAFSAPVRGFSQWLAGLDGEYDLLSLGPMTLVPRILQRRSPRRFVFMGGNIAEVPNFHGYEVQPCTGQEGIFRRSARACAHGSDDGQLPPPVAQRAGRACPKAGD